MSDLVKRLRRAKGSELLPKILLGHKNAEIACLEAADRIEELERELVAEKALADEICAASEELAKIARFFTGDKGGKTLAETIDKMNEIVTAYRKARGL